MFVIKQIATIHSNINISGAISTVGTMPLVFYLSVKTVLVVLSVGKNRIDGVMSTVGNMTLISLSVSMNLPISGFICQQMSIDFVSLPYLGSEYYLSHVFLVDVFVIK